MNLQYTDKMTGEEYNALRMSVDWRPISDRQAKSGLAHTAYLGDIIVRPEYQGKGIGRRIVELLIDKTMESVCEGERVMFILGAAKDKEAFYEKLGFHGRPNEFSGAGMSMWRTKEK